MPAPLQGKPMAYLHTDQVSLGRVCDHSAMSGLGIDLRIQCLLCIVAQWVVALGNWLTEALKHNSTQNDLPEELFYIGQDSMELFCEG